MVLYDSGICCRFLFKISAPISRSNFYDRNRSPIRVVEFIENPCISNLEEIDIEDETFLKDNVRRTNKVETYVSNC